MARPSPAPADADALVAAAAKQPRAVYLFVGEAFRTEQAARALIDVLVPESKRSFNLEVYDGRTTSIVPILDSLRMPGFFPGRKVVWIRDPALFLSGEKRADIAADLFAAWAEERVGEAADRFLTLAALAGWTQQQLADADFAELPDSEIKDFLGRAPEPDDRTALRSLRAHCIERNLTVSGYRDESGLFEDFLSRGIPPSASLVFTAQTVDRRKRVFKAVAEAGAVVELTVERERSGALTAEAVAQMVDAAAARERKRIAPAAHRLILQRAGNDPAQLANELEKLFLYVGAAPTVSEDDVRTSFRDLAESWIFDFTRALGQRDTTGALTLLRKLFAQGEHPLRLMAMIAREVRLLLLARDCLTGSLKGKWNQGVRFPDFRDRLLPLLSEKERAAVTGIHPYSLFLTMQNAGRANGAALRAAVLRLQELDVKFKTSAGDPRILLEAFVLDLCRS